jgi:hypothetical protein
MKSSWRQLTMTKTESNAPVRLLPLVLCVAILAGCGGAPQPDPPLSADNLNLIFVVSEDLAHNVAGDINPRTANLTSRGLQRALRMGSFLKQNVLGGQNVSGIFTLEPTTHPQTVKQYPDIVPLETMQQFAMLNVIEQWHLNDSLAASSFPLDVSYPSDDVPDGVVRPFLTCSNRQGLEHSCQGLDFRDPSSANEAMLRDLITANSSGFYVFAAPWETVTAMMAWLNRTKRYELTLPTTYEDPNRIYAISIAPSGLPIMVTYDTKIDPPSSYPVLPAGGIVQSACLPATTHTEFHVEIIGGADGAVTPAGINTNETVYLVRHAEAHPTTWWEDGNTVGAGQWRALDLPWALEGKIHPTQVYSIDPAQVLPGSNSAVGDTYSYVRTNTTVLPYAIANNLPYNLAAGFSMMAQNPPQLSTQASDFFFTGGAFSNQTLLVGWEHDHIPTTVNALLSTYHGGKTVPDWPGNDYDTIWTVKLDAHGNVSVDNSMCEGISSKDLPGTAPAF